MDSKTTVNEIKTQVEEFISKRDWSQFHGPKNLSMAISIEASELMDLFKWYSSEECETIMEQDKIHESATDEIADIMIYAISFCNRNNIDISQAIKQKLEKNNKKYPADKYKGLFKL